MKEMFNLFLRQFYTSRAHRHAVGYGMIFTLGGLLLMMANVASATPVLTFDQVSDNYITTTGRVNTLAFTIESWVRQTTADAENQIFTQDGGTGRIFYSIWGARPTLQISGVRKHADTTLTLNTWHHFAVTRDANGYVTMYLDGQLVFGPDYYNKDLPATSANTLTSIGLLLRSKKGFKGDLAELRIWNGDRTQFEIQASMNRRLTGSEVGLVHYWPLDEGSGVTVYDQAGSANGVITAARWTDNALLPIMADLPSSSWSSTTSGGWGTSANWLKNQPAQGVGTMALFTNQPPTAITVNNDMSALKLGSITIDGANSHTFTGNAITLTNLSGSATITSQTGSHVLDLPLATTAAGLNIITFAPSTLAINGVVSGSGTLAVNPANSGGGTVTLGATNTFVAPLTLGCGTLAVAYLANGGEPSAIGAATSAPTNLILGPGTLRYTGPATTIDRGLTANAGPRKAALIAVDNELTITGPITNVMGALIKTGPGTLIYAAPVASVLGHQRSADMAGQNSQAPYPANGDSPDNGFGCFTIANGKVILGAHPAQSNLFNQEVTVGAYTTDQAGQETTAELEFVGGYHRFASYLDVGYFNGNATTAPTPLQPTVTIKEGATVSANQMIIAFGYDYFGAPNTRAVVNIDGGDLTIDTNFRFGDQRGDHNSPMHATLNMTSGTFRHNGNNGTFRMGYRNDATGSADSTLNLFGGLFEVAYDIKMGGALSTATINLMGGILRVRNFVHDTANGTSRLIFNGGVLQPHTSGFALTELSEAVVSTNGALIDTSLAPYTIGQNLLHDATLGASVDGGLIKTGLYPLILACDNATYNGTTTINEGELRIGGSATHLMTLANLAIDAGAAIGFCFNSDGSSNDRLHVAASPTFVPGSLVALTLVGTELPFTKNGTYTILTYSGADPTVANLACATSVPGKTYTFAASAGTLTVTIGDGSAVWQSDANGTWATASNWTTAPLAGDHARFDAVITAPRTITTAGQTAGALLFNNDNSYTLAGSGLTLGSGATLSIERGAHAITAPLTLTDSAAVTLAPGSALTLGAVTGIALTAEGYGALKLTATPNLGAIALDIPQLTLSDALTISTPIALAQATAITPVDDGSAELAGSISGSSGLTKSGASTLTLSGINSYTGVTHIDNGTLTIDSIADGGQPCAIGAANGAAADLRIGAGTLRYSGPSKTVQRGLTLAAPQGSAAIVNIDADTELALTGPFTSSSGSFVKAGPGTLRLAQSNGANKLMTHAGVNETARINIGPNGESPTQGFSGVSVVEGKLALGAPGQTNTLSRIFVGLFSTDLPGRETTGELEICDGVLNLSNTLLAVGRNNGNEITAPGGISSRLTVRGGLITNVNHISLGYQNVKHVNYNARPIMEMSGGEAVINNFFISETAGSKSTVIFTGGTIRPLLSARFGMAANTEALMVMDGEALFQTDGNYDITIGQNSSAGAVASSATLRLNGGTLSTRNIIKSAPSTGVIYFSGGTLKPHTAGQTLQDLTAVYISTNGAVVDVSLVDHTIAQALLTDQALDGALDGGLLKLGENTLTLTATGNNFCGPIAVNKGLLRARLAGNNPLSVAAGATFDALGERCTISDLTGSGTLSNGVIAVTGAIDPGTNNAPAGASITIDDLALTAGATLACTWSSNNLGQVTCDTITVNNSLSVEGHGYFDLGRDEGAPIPMPFRMPFMTCDSLNGSFVGWRAVNTGLPKGKATAATVTIDASGTLTLHVRYSGTLFMLQ